MLAVYEANNTILAVANAVGPFADIFGAIILNIVCLSDVYKP